MLNDSKKVGHLGMNTASSKCQGSIAFMLAAVILPFLFLLFALSIDVTKFLREEQLAQKRIDDAALFAYRFLPYQQEAQLAARNYLSQFGDGSENAEVTVDADSVTIRYSTQSVPTFAQFFVSDTMLNYTVLSRARGTPFDTMIFMDSGSYLSPHVLTGTAWGEEVSWPAATFFLHERAFMYNNSPVSPRLLTQQCFNPLFSVVKQTTIQMYEYLAGFRFNSVGVGIFPGSSGNWVDTIRPMQFGEQPVVDGDGIAWGEASFKPFNVQFGSSELCAAAAEREGAHQDYRFPGRSDSLPGLWSPPPGAPPMITAGAWELNPDYRPFMRLSQSIWSRVTHYQPPNSDEVLSEFYSRALPLHYVERKGLSNESRRTAIIVAADVPYAGGVRFQNGSDSVAAALSEQFELLRQAALNDQSLYIAVYYVVLEARTEPGELADLRTRLDEFENYIAVQGLIGGQSLPQFELKLIRAGSPQELIRGVGAHLVLEKKTTVLSR